MLKNHFLGVNFAYICFHYVKGEYKGVKLVKHESFKSIKEIKWTVGHLSAFHTSPVLKRLNFIIKLFFFLLDVSLIRGQS